MCEICAKDFVTNYELRNHRDNEHRIENDEINPTNELKSIGCDICAKIFTSLELEAYLDFITCHTDLLLIYFFTSHIVGINDELCSFLNILRYIQHNTKL
jgi:hypothetical protein